MHLFVKIPRIPEEFKHQQESVELKTYLVTEGQIVEVGTPLAVIENWWASFEIQAVSRGVVAKLFFDDKHSKTIININDPIGIINCSSEDAPEGDETSKIVVKEVFKKSRAPGAPG